MLSPVHMQSCRLLRVRFPCQPLPQPLHLAGPQGLHQSQHQHPSPPPPSTLFPLPAVHVLRSLHSTCAQTPTVAHRPLAPPPHTLHLWLQSAHSRQQLNAPHHPPWHPSPHLQQWPATFHPPPPASLLHLQPVQLRPHPHASHSGWPGVLQQAPAPPAGSSQVLAPLPARAAARRSPLQPPQSKLLEMLARARQQQTRTPHRRACMRGCWTSWPMLAT